MLRAKHPGQKLVMVIVDYPLQNEIDRDFPWSGASHLSLVSDLTSAGVGTRDIHTTYLAYERPDKESFDWSTEFKKKKDIDPDKADNWFHLAHQKDLYISAYLNSCLTGLIEEIKKVNPKIIVIAGKWALFLLTGRVPYSATQGTFKAQKPLGGLAKFRASIETTHPSFGIEENIVIPILPPITRQRDPSKIPVLKWDYLKIADIYKALTSGKKQVSDYLVDPRELLIGTQFDDVIGFLNSVLEELDKDKTLVSVDIETRFSSTIDCIGIASSNSKGMCIPFSTLSSPNFWTAEEEYSIHEHILKVLSHHNILVTGQNYAYDAQFIWKFWGIKTEAFVDTMILHHVLYNNMEKNLAFLASVYCENYTYWKDEQQH